jgi:hypothetical protein
MGGKPMKTATQIIDELRLLEANIKLLKAQKADMEQALATMFEDDIRDKLSGKDYGCGTATIKTDDYKLKFTVSKKVKYDQSKLPDIEQMIANAGDKPERYMKREYKISENDFKQWPLDIQKVFEGVRTVEPSKPKLKIEKVGE